MVQSLRKRETAAMERWLLFSNYLELATPFFLLEIARRNYVLEMTSQQYKLKKSRNQHDQAARKRLGDWERGAVDQTTGDKHNDPLPINADDGPVTLEKRTAAVERWLPFSWAAGSNHTHVLWEKLRDKIMYGSWRGNCTS
jgi:hypothetical protein